MAQRKVIFEVSSLMQLLTAYYDGLVPLDAKVLNIGISDHFNRWVGFLIESEQWSSDADIKALTDGQHPLFLRYEGRRNMAWSKSDGPAPITWGKEGTDFEIPK